MKPRDSRLPVTRVGSLEVVATHTLSLVSFVWTEMFGIDLLGRQAGSQAPGRSEGRGFQGQDTGLGWAEK